MARPWLICAAWLALNTAALAQTPVLGPAERQSPTPGPVGGPPVPQGPSPGEPGFTTQLFSSSRSTLLGDMFGLRTALANYGISLGVLETSEVFGNVSGGVRRQAAYDGLTTLTLGIDTQRAFGWDDGSINISALQLHGRNLSADTLLTLQTASGIEGTPATRLWEAWYQQVFLHGMADIKIGQQSLDQEFIDSLYAGTFLNTMMGWPVVPSYDLYAGGPAYPLSSLGARLRARYGAWTVLGGVFDDNPSGGPFNNDSQVRGGAQSGTRFNLNTGALFIAEVQYAFNQPSEGLLVGADARPGLPGTYKLGAWFDTGSFPDQRIDNTGLSLADPNSSGIARMRRQNFSVYAVMDQVVWQPDPEKQRSIGVFARVMGAPGDRNLIDLGVNAGIVLKAPLPGRNDDSFGVGYGLARVGRNASLLDQDTGSGPVRSSESFIEVTYQIQLAPWWQVQPDFQYAFTPGGGVADPNRPGKRIGNEAVFGLRTNITF